MGLGWLSFFAYTFADKTTIDKSLFYNPIQKMAAMIYPYVEEWYKGIKVKSINK
jgi:membrane protein required for colicin V production